MGFFLHSANNTKDLSKEFVEFFNQHNQSIFVKTPVLTPARYNIKPLIFKLSQDSQFLSNIKHYNLNEWVLDFYLDIKNLNKTHFQHSKRLIWEIFKILPQEKNLIYEKIKASVNEDITLYNCCKKIANQLIEIIENTPVQNIKNIDPEYQQIWQQLIDLGFLDTFNILKDLSKLVGLKITNSEKYQKIIMWGFNYVSDFWSGGLKVISKLVDVHFFMLNPSHQYWLEADSPYGSGLYLLNNLAINQKITINNFLKHNLIDDFGKTVDPPPAYGHNLLELLQKSIKQAEIEKIKLPPQNTVKQQDATFNSDSLTGLSIFCCQNPYEEVYLLREKILQIYKQKNNTPLSLIVVMLEPEKYLIPIKNIFNLLFFEELQDLTKNTPKTNAQDKKELIDDFFELCSFLNSQIDCKDIFKIFSKPAVIKNFNINQNEINILKTAFKNLQISWGIDIDAFKKTQTTTLPEKNITTGLFSITYSILLGPIETHKILDINVPDNIMPTNASITRIFNAVSKFSQFYWLIVKWLENPLQSLLNKKTISHWHSLIPDLVKDFFGDSADSRKIENELLTIIAQLKKQLFIVDIENDQQKIDFGLFVNLVKNQLKSDHQQNYISSKFWFLNQLNITAIKDYDDSHFDYVFILGAESQKTLENSNASKNLNQINAELEDDISVADLKSKLISLIINSGQLLQISYSQPDLDNMDYLKSDLLTSIKGWANYNNLNLNIKADAQELINIIKDEAHPVAQNISINQSKTNNAAIENRHPLKIYQKFTEPDRLEISDLKHFWQNPTEYCAKKMNDFDFVNELTDYEKEAFLVKKNLESKILKNICELLIIAGDKTLPEKIIYQKFRHKLPEGPSGLAIFEDITAQAREIIKKSQFNDEKLIKDSLFLYQTVINVADKKLPLSGNINYFKNTKKNYYLKIYPKFNWSNIISSYIDYLIFKVSDYTDKDLLHVFLQVRNYTQNAKINQIIKFSSSIIPAEGDTRLIELIDIFCQHQDKNFFFSPKAAEEYLLAKKSSLNEKYEQLFKNWLHEMIEEQPGIEDMGMLVYRKWIKYIYKNLVLKKNKFSGDELDNNKQLTDDLEKASAVIDQIKNSIQMVD